MQPIRTVIILTKNEVLEVYAESTKVELTITYDGNKVFINGKNVTVDLYED